MTPFPLQHTPTLGEDVRPRGAGVLQPVAGLAITLAGGAFMTVLAVPAYIAAMRAARAMGLTRAADVAAAAADSDATTDPAGGDTPPAPGPGTGRPAATHARRRAEVVGATTTAA